MVAAGLAKKCTIQISYAIGVAQPLSFYVDLHDTGEIDPAKLEAGPAGDDRRRHAARPSASTWASTGRSTPAPRPTATSAAQPDNEGGFSWERTDLADELKPSWPEPAARLGARAEARRPRRLALRAPERLAAMRRAAV